MSGIIGIPERFKTKIKGDIPKLTGHEFTVFHGKPYTGKTHAACHTIFEAKGIASAMFIRADDYVDKMTVWLKDGCKDCLRDAMLAERSRFLIFDDYLDDKRHASDIWQARIGSLLRKRFDARKQTVITTNLHPDEIKKIISERIFSRCFSRENNNAVLYEFTKIITPSQERENKELWKDQEQDEAEELFKLAVSTNDDLAAQSNFLRMDEFKQAKYLATASPLLKEKMQIAIKINEDLKDAAERRRTNATLSERHQITIQDTNQEARRDSTIHNPVDSKEAKNTQ